MKVDHVNLPTFARLRNVSGMPLKTAVIGIKKILIGDRLDTRITGNPSKDLKALGHQKGIRIDMKVNIKVIDQQASLQRADYMDMCANRLPMLHNL